jgi:hypothetical protein
LPKQVQQFLIETAAHYGAGQKAWGAIRRSQVDGQTSSSSKWFANTSQNVKQPIKLKRGSKGAWLD